MAKKALAITPQDNVAVALASIEKNDVVRLSDGRTLTASEAIPFGHKLALVALAQGQAIIKYGQAIGLAMASIAEGGHVHVHNVESQRGRGDLGGR